MSPRSTTLATFVFLTLAGALPAEGNTLFLTAHHSDLAQGYGYAVYALDTQTGQFTNWWLMGGDHALSLPIAVDTTIRTVCFRPASEWACTGGGQYTLEGSYTGTVYANALPPGTAVTDSTTDTRTNYLVDGVSGTVYQTNLDYTNPVALFTILGASDVWSGISYDPSNNSLWLSQAGGTGEIADFSLSGVLLSSFSTGHTNSALAFDPQDSTLWLNDPTTAQFDLEHYSTEGTLLGTLGLPADVSTKFIDSVSGGEFAEVPEPLFISPLSSWFFVLLGFTLQRVRSKQHHGRA